VPPTVVARSPRADWFGLTGAPHARHKGLRGGSRRGPVRHAVANADAAELSDAATVAAITCVGVGVLVPIFVVARIALQPAHTLASGLF